MAEMNYIFGDCRTGQIIQEIRCQGVSMKDDLDTGGEWRGTFSLDQTGKLNSELLSATHPGRCFVVTERDGQIINDSILWTRTYQSQAKSMQLYGKGWKAYTEARVNTLDLTYTNMEQRNIMIQLYHMMQGAPNDLQVEVPDDFNDVVLRTLTVRGSDLKTYRALMNSIADGANGFDWVIETRREGNQYVRTLKIGYPYIGNVLSEDNAVVFEYPGNITNYWENESMGSPGTNFWAIGATDSETDQTIVSTYEHTDLTANGFPRFDVITSHKEVTSKSLLDDIVIQDAMALRPPMPILTVELKADQDPAIGSFKPGDLAQISIRDARHEETFRIYQRILSFDYYPASNDSEEMARVVFEGEEYAN